MTRLNQLAAMRTTNRFFVVRGGRTVANGCELSAQKVSVDQAVAEEIDRNF